MHVIKQITATLTENATTSLAALTEETEEDATSATAIPDAVIRVFPASEYIVLLCSLIQFHCRVWLSRQMFQINKKAPANTTIAKV